MKKYLISLLVFMSLLSAVNADVITLTNGHKIDCVKATKKGHRMIIEHDGGKISVPVRMIAKIQSGSLAAIQSKTLANFQKK